MATKQIQSIALDPTDNRKYIITLTDKIVKGESAKLTYTKGDVAAADTGLLQNIINFIIANNATVTIPHLVSATTNTAGTQVILTFDTSMADVSGKQGEFGVKVETVYTNQHWQGGVYPQTPIETSLYPYQVICKYNTTTKLFISNNPIHQNGANNLTTLSGSGCKSRTYQWNGYDWNLTADNTTGGGANSYTELNQANSDIYTDATHTTILFARTTPNSTTQLAISSSALDTNDNKKIILSINVDSGYQKWNGYPDSPVLTSSKPYQAIIMSGGSAKLIVNGAKFYVTSDSYIHSGNFTVYAIVSGSWVQINTNLSAYIYSGILQANKDIYADTTYTTVSFAKTTPTTSQAITNGQTVKASFTKGTVMSADGGSLESFVDVNVVNNVVSPYQQWSGYPDSPELTSAYPYQLLDENTSNGTIYLYLSSQPLCYNLTTKTISTINPTVFKRYYKTGSSWTFTNTYQSLVVGVNETLRQANNPVYTDSTLTTIYFAKTTL